MMLCMQYVYRGTSLLRTLWDLNFSPYYGGVLNSEVNLYTAILHYDTEWCPYYRGFCNSEVCNSEVPLYMYVCIYVLVYFVLSLQCMCVFVLYMCVFDLYVWYGV